jgi:biopolymer transport protein TolR
MGMSGPSREGGMMSEINVTPFVDVMLVLLIIFMVTAPLMTTGVELELPRADAPALATDEEQLVLSVDAESKYFLQDQSFSAEELRGRLAAIAQANPGKPLFVRADGKLPYETVLQALALARASGMTKVGLVTQPGAAPAASAVKEKGAR